MKYRVTFLITGLAPGGAETQLVRLALGLQSLGWGTNIISMLRPEHFLPDLDRQGIPVLSLNMQRGVPDPRALVTVTRLLRQYQPHVLICFLFHANLLGRLGGKIAKVPVIISSIRNENFGGSHRDWLLRITDGLGDITITNSHLVAESLIARKVVPASRLQVIPNGLSPLIYAPNPALYSQKREELEVDAEQFLWLSIGRLEKQKDYFNLLQAFALVVKEHPLSQIRIAGHGVLLDPLQQQAIKLGIKEHCRFLGLRYDVPALLNAADGVVLSSAWEGFPNVIMEALATGKPIVATNVGGVPELMRDGEYGFLVPPNNPIALAQAMSRLMKLSDIERLNMGAAGRQYIEQNYTMDSYLRKWNALLHQLISNELRNQ